MRGIGAAGGDERGNRTRLVDAFLQDLAVRCFSIGQQRLVIMGLVQLADARVDAVPLEQCFHSERAGLVWDDGYDPLADVLVLQHVPQNGHEPHGGRDGSVVAAMQQRLEQFQRRGIQYWTLHGACGHEAPEFLPLLSQILQLLLVLLRLAERRLCYLVVRNGNAKARAELDQLLFIEFLLLVRDVAPLARFTQAVAFDRLGQDDGRRSPMFDGRPIGGVDLFRIMSAPQQFAQLVVRHVLDQAEQFRMAAEEGAPNVIPRLDSQPLVFAVDHLRHALGQQAVLVALEQRIPVASPDHFDNVPAGATERGLQLLNDFAVAANRPIQALQVTVDDEDKVVQFLARRHGQGAKRFRLVRLAVAHEAPDVLGAGVFQAAMLQVAIEAGLVDGHQGPQPHGDGGKLPEIGHQPGVRIRGQTASGAEFPAEVPQFLLVESSFQVGPGVNPRRCVALEVDLIRAARGFGAVKEVVLADFDQCSGGGIRRNVPADTRLVLVGLDDHGHGVPAGQADQASRRLRVPGSGGCSSVGMVFR